MRKEPTAPTPHAVPPEALAALQRGQKIEATKIIREQLGLDLKTAKDLADSLPVVPTSPPAPTIIQRPASLVLPALLGLAALWLLVQAGRFVMEGSNASYCATATKGKHLLCQAAPGWAENVLGEGQGYIGSALVLVLLAAIVAFMALASRRGQGRQE